MSIRVVREALKAAAIAGAETATMRYGEGGVQIYAVGGREIERPADELSSPAAAGGSRASGRSPMPPLASARSARSSTTTGAAPAPFPKANPFAATPSPAP